LEFQKFPPQALKSTKITIKYLRDIQMSLKRETNALLGKIFLALRELEGHHKRVSTNIKKQCNSDPPPLPTFNTSVRYNTFIHTLLYSISGLSF
jgi:hypothetical protein